jgi:hypothetical protein
MGWLVAQRLQLHPLSFQRSVSRLVGSGMLRLSGACGCRNGHTRGQTAGQALEWDVVGEAIADSVVHTMAVESPRPRRKVQLCKAYLVLAMQITPPEEVRPISGDECCDNETEPTAFLTMSDGQKSFFILTVMATTVTKLSVSYPRTHLVQGLK